MIIMTTKIKNNDNVDDNDTNCKINNRDYNNNINDNEMNHIKDTEKIITVLVNLP